jgi:hypothetical protein
LPVAACSTPTAVHAAVATRIVSSVNGYQP